MISSNSFVLTKNGYLPCSALHSGKDLVLTGDLLTFAPIKEIIITKYDKHDLVMIRGDLVCTPDTSIYCLNNMTHYPIDDWPSDGLIIRYSDVNRRHELFTMEKETNSLIVPNLLYQLRLSEGAISYIANGFIIESA